jgi:excinuclease ABC subunit C
VLERPTGIPDAPGSYQFKDADGRILYVGKARSLRARLANYFGDPRQLHPRTAQMLERAASVEWIQVRSDVEAIMLEYNLIKTHRPRFNVRLVDDKSYPYLAVTVNDTYPRALVMRGAKRKGTRYFGPYAHAYAIRETLDLLLRSFPIRTCSDTKFSRHERLGRPCLLYDIERCSGPCVKAIAPDEYGALVTDLMAFLEGDTGPVVERIEQEMLAASESLEFEHAARLRDQLSSVRMASERQEMVGDPTEEIDIVAVADDELEAAAQILHVRRGRVVGRSGFILEKVEPLGSGELVGRVIETHYAESPLDVPRTVLVSELPDDVETYAAWLATRRAHKVEIRVPQRGRKRDLLEVARTNAREQLVRHRLRRTADLTTRALALEELQRYLGLPDPPLRIECYDMSHLSGTDYVGSMVVMEDGLPKRSDYRRFKVSAVQGNDDYGAMAEVLTRRLRRIDEPQKAAELGRPTRFAYPPNLLLLDGGKGQLTVGIRVLAELGLTDRLAVASLAKQFEEVFVPGREAPIRIPRDSDAIYLLQQIRDEAHRFAITYHRELRGKRMTKGALDGVPGLGEKRRRRLVAELGGVTKVRSASPEELRALPWLPGTVADAVYLHLHPNGPTPPGSAAPPGRSDAEDVGRRDPDGRDASGDVDGARLPVSA